MKAERAAGSDLLNHISYFVPTISNIPTTGRYNHAIELSKHAENSQLLTMDEPPRLVEEQYDEVHVIEKEGPMELLRSARAAAKIVDRTIETKTTKEIFVTTFHFTPVVAGYLSNAYWVVSVHDDIFQGIFNNPLSNSQITDRVAKNLIKRSDRRVYTIRPNSPPPNTTETRYVNNGIGCPIDLIEPHDTPNDVLNAVWVGKTRLDQGQQLLLETLERMSDRSIEVDVYGDPAEEARSLAAESNLDGIVTYHGHRPHGEVREAIGRADIGLCVLPARPDWLHTATVKVREYLAGGAIPVVSNFPGLRQLAKENAIYVTPESRTFASALNYLLDLSTSDVRKMKEQVRNYAETMPLSEGRKWYARQVTGQTGFATYANGV